MYTTCHSRVLAALDWLCGPCQLMLEIVCCKNNAACWCDAVTCNLIYMYLYIIVKYLINAEFQHNV